MIKMAIKRNELMQLKVNGKLVLIDESVYRMLEELKEDERLILVEGKEDEKALEILGIDRERIIKISSMPAHKLLETICKKNCRSVINMLDCDREGRKKTAYLRKVLKNVEIDEKFRKNLLLRVKTSFVEGLPTAIESAGKIIQ